MSFIEDGTGKGNKVKVTDANELITRTISEDALFDLITKGRGVFTSHNTTLTDDVDTPIIAVTNNTTGEVIIPAFSISCDKSNESTGVLNVRQTLGIGFKLGLVTTDMTIPGLLIPYKASNAVPNTGIDILTGTTGNTLTPFPIPPQQNYVQGGSLHVTIINQPFFLAPGDTASFFVKPPIGNTSLIVTVTATFLINDGTL